MLRLKNIALAGLASFLFTTSSQAQNYNFTTFVGSAGLSGSTDGTGNAARLARPIGLVTDSAGNLFVADTVNRTLRKITPTGATSTIAGQVNSIGTANGPAATAQFNVAWGTALDTAGNLYIADQAAHTIRKLSTDGVVSTFAGTAGTAGSADLQGTLASFNGPASIAIDSGGNVFVADGNNSVIRKITPAGQVSTFAGVSGATGAVDGMGSAARFLHPAGIAIDGANNLYVADTDNQVIRKITPAGLVSTLAGSAGVTGSIDGIGSAARFFVPISIAVDAAGNVFVSELGSNTLRHITSAGVVSTIGGQAGPSGSVDGIGSVARFNQPYGLTVDRNGVLYVSDTFNHTIRKGTPVPTFTVATGSTVVLSTASTGSGLTYQWKQNGLSITGATTSTYVFSGQPSSAGVYAIDVTSGGSTTSTGVGVVTVVDSTNPGRITNLAIRSQAGTGAQTLIVGTVLGGAGTAGAKSLLMRGVGPSLTTFGVTGVLADPVMTVFNESGKFAENDDWAGTFDFASLGAFPFTGASPKDAAIYSTTISSGNYSIQVTGKNNATGTALAEVYDATPVENYTAATPRLVNVSARTQVGTGGDILIAGFTIGGSTSKTVLIRAAGPALIPFGVGGVLADPKLELYVGQTKVAENDDWSTAGGVSAVSIGFPFAAGSKDATLLITLPPGGYTAQVTGVGGTTGVALVEVYEVP